MRCCLPVKNGWQFEHTSTCSSGFVEIVWNVLPHAHTTFDAMYLGWIFSFMGLVSLALRDDAHAAAIVAGGGIGHGAGGEGEQRVVLADADVGTREQLRAALADDDRPGVDDATRVLLHAESLSGGVA